MSERIVHVGKLLKIDRHEGESVENWCKEYFNQNNNINLAHYYDSWEECFIDYYSDDFIIIDNNIYQIIEDRNFNNRDDIFESSINDLGQIEYCLSYHSGGCGFGEAIRKALESMDNSVITNHLMIDIKEGFISNIKSFNEWFKTASDLIRRKSK